MPKFPRGTQVGHDDRTPQQTQTVAAVADGASATQLSAALAVLMATDPKSLTPDQRSLLAKAIGAREREPVTHSKTAQVRVGEIREKEGKLSGATLEVTFEPTVRRKNVWYPVAKMTPELMVLAAAQGARETTYRTRGNKGYWIDDGSGRPIVSICKGWTEELTLEDGTPVARLSLDTERDLDEVPDSVIAYLGLTDAVKALVSQDNGRIGASAMRLESERGVSRRAVGA